MCVPRYRRGNIRTYRYTDGIGLNQEEEEEKEINSNIYNIYHVRSYFG